VTGPVQLGDLIRDGKLLWGYCRACCRQTHCSGFVVICQHGRDGRRSGASRALGPFGIERLEPVKDLVHFPKKV